MTRAPAIESATTDVPASRDEATFLPYRSRLLLWWFRHYARRYLARHFHAVRVARDAVPPHVDGPLIVYLNHPAWWDPLVCFLLARRFWPGRAHFAPIDAAALAKYRFFRKLGFFGVEPASAAGARQLIRNAGSILRHPSAVLWITAAGRFTDPRVRPVELMPGLAHLARRFPQVTLLPLAVEYPFWQEKSPEALARFGPPIPAGTFAGATAQACLGALESHLEATQDALAAASVAADASAFVTVLGGQAGVSPVYDAYRRLRCFLRGERFNPEHREAP